MQGRNKSIAVANEERVVHGHAWWRKRGSDRLLPCEPVAIQRTRVNAGGFDFDALASGPKSGELVLLLHGFPQSSSIWRGALATLGTAGYRAVAPDQRGYSLGARPEGVDEYRISALSDDVLDIADALGAKRFHLIGHDWGGTVAWTVAGEHPDRVATLTAISTPHTAALRTALRGTAQRARMAYIPLLQLPKAAEMLFDAGGGALAEAALAVTGLPHSRARRDVASLRRSGPTGPLNWYRALGRDTTAHVKPVSVPTLHVWGTHDVAFGRQATELTARHVTGEYHLLELDGGSHWIPDEHWDDIEDVVVDHLRAHRAAGQSSST